MTARAVATIEIATSPQRAYAFVANLENDAKWARFWTSVRTSSTGGVGATYRRTYRAAIGPGTEATVTVTAFEPPDRFAFESRTKTSVARIEYTFVATSTGVRVTKRDEMTHDGALGTIVAWALTRGGASLLQRLKRALEQGGPLTPRGA